MLQTNQKLLAQAPTQIGTIGEGEGFGPFRSGQLTNPAAAAEGVVSFIIGIMTIVAGLYFMVQLVIGGIEWIGSGGDKNKLQKAQDRMSYGTLGLIIVVAAYGIAAIIATVTGFNFLNPASLLTTIGS